MMNPWLADICASFLTLVSAVNGFFLTRWLLPRGTGFKVRAAAGTVLGIALFAWLGFLPAFSRGLRPAGIGITAIILFFLLFIFCYLRSEGFSNLRSLVPEFPKFSKGGFFYYGFWAVLLGVFYGRVLIFKPDGVFAAPANNFGDLAYHLNVISSFAFGGNFPPQEVAYAGTPYAYPFLADFLSSFFIYMGTHWSFSLFLGNFLLGFSMIFMLEALTRELTGNKLAARLAPFIFIFSGGLDFIVFFKHLAAVPSWNLSSIIAAIPKTYVFGRTLDLGAYGKIPLAWGDCLGILLTTQRSLLFGIPFACWIVLLWHRAVSTLTPDSEKRNYWIAAGILTGLLPLLHMHTFFCLILMAGIFWVLFYRAAWLYFFFSAFLLAAPQIAWIKTAHNHYPLFMPYLGWMAGDKPIWIFWLVNNGMFLILLVLQLLRPNQGNLPPRKFYIPVGFLFVSANFFLMAPHYWDNVKVFTVWAFLSAPWVAQILADLLTRRGLRIAGIFALTLMMLSPVLYAVRCLSPHEVSFLFPRVEWEIANEFRKKMLPHSVAAHAPVHNNLMQLTGAVSFLGYPAHVTTHGINDAQRNAELSMIFTAEDAQADRIIALNPINFILVGPQERAVYGSRLNENFFRKHFPAVLERGGYTIYLIPRSKAEQK